MKLINIPQVCEFNPYVEILSAVQKGAGLNVISNNFFVDGFNPKQIEFSASKVLDLFGDGKSNVLHLHWPEKFYDKNNGEKFVEALRVIKNHGVKIIRTLHNKTPHHSSKEIKQTDEKINSCCDCIHVFSERQKKLVDNQFKDKKIVVIPHINYPSRFIENLDVKKNKLKALFQDKSLTYILIFGRIRSYKNINNILNAINLNNNDNLRFIFSGYSSKTHFSDRVLELEKQDYRVTYINDFIDQTMIDYLFFNSDLVALFYKAWSSGVANLAINYSKPVCGIMPKSIKTPNSDLSIEKESVDAINSCFEKIAALSSKDITKRGLEFREQNFVNNEIIQQLYTRLYSSI